MAMRRILIVSKVWEQRRAICNEFGEVWQWRTDGGNERTDNLHTSHQYAILPGVPFEQQRGGILIPLITVLR
jgi:hypothetical protein